MKASVRKEYIRTKLMELKLNAGNVIRAGNAWVMAILKFLTGQRKNYKIWSGKLAR